MDKKFLNISVALVVAISMALFFSIALLSNLPVLIKAVVLLVELALTGFAIHKLTGVDSFYGVLIVRGLAGFDVMKWIAKHYGSLAKVVCDVGSTVSFGFIYSAIVFGPKRAIKHALILAAFSGVLSFFISQRLGLEFAGLFVFGLAFGLAGLGLAEMALHSLRVLTVSNTPPGVSLLIPGVTVPWEAIVSIAILAVVHEVAHGVLCYVEKLPLKASGGLFFGFIPIGAFVEPDEKKLEKLSIEKKRRILAAGSVSNLLFFVFFAILSLAFTALILPLSVQGVNDSYTGEKIYDLNGQKVSLAEKATPFYLNTSNPLVKIGGSSGSREGRMLKVVIVSIVNSSPASGVLNSGEEITRLDGKMVYSLENIAEVVSSKNPGDSLKIETNVSNYSVALSSEKKIGVNLALTPALKLENVPVAGLEIIYSIFVLLASILSLTSILNLLAGIVNLLPLFITDGHKMIYYEFVEWFGKKNAEKLAVALGIFTLLLLGVNALPWFFK